MTPLSVTLGKVEETMNFHYQVSPPERGRILVGQYTPAQGRKWVLSWDAVGDTTVNAIETALTATIGGSISMVWTAPGDSAATRVRFAQGEEGYSKEQITSGTYHVQVTLLEQIENQPLT